MRLYGSWDRGQDDGGTLNTRDATWGILTTSASTVSTTETSFISTETQRPEEGEGGLVGIHVTPIRATAVLTRRWTSTIALTASIFGVGTLLGEAHGGQERRQRLWGHTSGGSGPSGCEVIGQGRVLVISGGGPLVTFHRRRSPLVTSHVTKGR